LDLAVTAISLAEAKASLEVFLGQAAQTSQLWLTEVRPLSGGAIQENWLLEADVKDGPQAGKLELVLRTDSMSVVSDSHTRPQEFALLRAAWQAGVRVPEPLWLNEDPDILGRPFYVMRRVAGTAMGHRLVKDKALGGDRAGLARQLGRELAKIHTIRPPRPDLAFLGTPPRDPARDEITRLRKQLDLMGCPNPALEWALRWSELQAPAPERITLVHGDFRTGNYMVGDNGLTGILDWEFCAWSDPMADLGWFCAKCWRFGQDDLEAGGIAARSEFYRGYEDESGCTIDSARVAFWEVMAHIRWAVIAIQQGERTLSGGEVSLDLALTGRIYPPQLEHDLLAMTAPARWSQSHA
jgi:aminoglycoside phosphotransferase (APT) family kinase protein